MRRSLTLEGAGLVIVASGIASSEKDAGKTLRYLDFIREFVIAVSNIATGGTRFKPKAAEALGSLRGNLERAAGKNEATPPLKSNRKLRSEKTFVWELTRKPSIYTGKDSNDHAPLARRRPSESASVSRTSSS